MINMSLDIEANKSKSCTLEDKSFYFNVRGNGMPLGQIQVLKQKTSIQMMKLEVNFLMKKWMGKISSYCICI